MKESATNKKRLYVSPVFNKIEIDKDISLQLASSPPAGPSETYNSKNNELANPFKINMV